VGDDVDPLRRQLLDPPRELSGTHGDGGGARDPRSMDVDADTLDPLGEPAEVGNARGPDRELVEAEEPVKKDDRMTWPDPAARPPHATQPTATAAPDEGGGGSEAESGGDQDEDFAAHERTPPFPGHSSVRPISSAGARRNGRDG
jgi:hypothetical protein